MPTQRTRSQQRLAPADPRSLEEQVRQLLADKISGNQVGIWLLVPEHLRLGTWDLLLGWTGRAGDRVEPRLGLHLINAAAIVPVLLSLSTNPFPKRLRSSQRFALRAGRSGGP